MGKSSGRKKKSAEPISRQDPPPANGDAAADLDPSLFLKRAHELKEEGNRLFQSKDYAAALGSYDRALRLLPRGHPDRAVFHSNRAACLMQMRPVDHHAVAAECSLALQAQPNFPRALLRRARALDALRRHDLALSDVNALLALDPSNRDALDLAKKLQEAVVVAAAAPTERHDQQQQQQQVNPSPAALGASAVRGAPIAGLGPCLPARPVPKKSTSPPPVHKLDRVSQVTPNSPNLNVKSGPLPNGLPEVVLKPAKQVAAATATESVRMAAVAWPVSVATTKWRPLKLVYDHDIRLAQMPVKCTFKTLREIVAKRFPSSKAVLVKYKDEDGDLVTVTNTAELRLAETSVDKGTKEGDHAGKEETLALLRLHVVEVSPEQEPEVLEEEEVEEKHGEDDALIKGDESLTHLSTGDESVSPGLENDIMRSRSEEEATQLKAKEPKKECDHAECKEVEIDDWLYDFAQLFRQQVGIDPDAHLDLHELGTELCSEALEETVTSEDAQKLFEMAAAKFQEVAALAFFNWGNVHMCAARKKIPLDESSPKDVMEAQLQVAYDWVRERYALAGGKYEESFRIKPDFYEGLLALGQQHFETAKLHWSFALAKKIDLTQWNYSETIKLFDSAEQKMKSATEMWEKVEEERLNELKDPNLSKKDELLKKRKKQGASDNQGELSAAEAAEQAAVMRSQIHLFWGNMLFERSQVEYKLGFGDWKKNLDTAVERFKLAGASETDISVVLKNHASSGSEHVMECDE